MIKKTSKKKAVKKAGVIQVFTISVPYYTTYTCSAYIFPALTAEKAYKLASKDLQIICDEEGLDLEQKNTMCATIGAESGWIPTAIHKNILNGKVFSTDFGICQWNDYYHGKEITPDEAVNDPEKAVRLMCALLAPSFGDNDPLACTASIIREQLTSTAVSPRSNDASEYGVTESGSTNE